MNLLTYKHIEIIARPEKSNLVEGKVAFFFDNNLYNYSFVSDSEAEVLVNLNKHVKEFGQKLKQLNP